MSQLDGDVIFVGGGLAAGLAAYLMSLERPDLRVLVLDGGRPMGWDQTWSFQVLQGASDPSSTYAFKAPLSSWLAPLISGYWDAYELRFPELERLIPTHYASIRYVDFKHKLQKHLGAAYRSPVWVTQLHAQHVVLADSSILRARCVIDGRGWSEDRSTQSEGYQKFLGLHVRTQGAHGLRHPIMMDACVAQQDGFRFFYVLPWSADELLIEDTCYSRGFALDAEAYRQNILEYAHAKGWKIAEVLGTEEGSLPLPCYGCELCGPPDIATIGVRGGFFHPTTGYSIYEAVQIAEWLAKCSDWTPQLVASGLWKQSQARWKDLEFYRRLNNMLFFAAADDQRYKVLQKFYKHEQGLIARFHAGQTRGWDKLKILSGKPPVPIDKGILRFCSKAGASYGAT